MSARIDKFQNKTSLISAGFRFAGATVPHRCVTLAEPG